MVKQIKQSDIKPLKLSKKEHNVEKDIIKAIIKKRGYVIKNQASGTTGRGRPDLSACINGQYCAIEVKRNHGTIETTVFQLVNLLQVVKAGGLAFYSKSSKMFNLEPFTKNGQTGQLIKFTNTININDILYYLRQSDIIALQIINEHQFKIYQK